MLSFVDYIHESVIDELKRKEDARKYAETVKKDCAKFIEASKDSGMVLCRYVNRPVVGMIKIVPRIDRQPVDTPLWLHNYMDELFLKKFGWKARSEGVFAIATKRASVGYYESYHPMFPIGDYDFIWSPKVTDLYLTLKDKAMDFEVINWRTSTEFPHNNPQFELSVERLVKTYKDNDLQGYYKSQPPEREIAIRCKAYYSVEASLGQDVLDGVYG